MSDPVRANKMASVSIELYGDEARIEKLPAKENEPALIRLSVWNQGEMKESPLALTQKELINLLQVGIRAGILTRNFLTELGEAFEI